MTESTGPVQGGCFCGAVRYEVDDGLLMYRYCYCSRCRKMRGTAHASNIFVEPDALRWLAGEDTVKRFDLEGARFGNNFCPNCGSPVPRLTTGGKSYLIPAGSLDADPGARADVAIFYDDRAPWMPGADALEKRSEY
jgi:hypothetical protein